MISFVIPFYNNISVVIGTIEKLMLNLKKHNFLQNAEILLCDDASTEEDFDRLLVWRDKYLSSKVEIRILRGYINRGPSSRRNIGVSNATKQFIWFLDSDDELDLSGLEKYWQKIHNLDYVFFGSARIKSNKKSFCLIEPERWNIDEFIDCFYKRRKSLLVYSQIGMFLFKKSFLIENDLYFRNCLRTSEDTEFKVRLLSKDSRFSVILDKKVTLIKNEHLDSLGNLQKSVLSNRLYKIKSGILVLNIKGLSFKNKLHIMSYILYQGVFLLKYGTKSFISPRIT